MLNWNTPDKLQTLLEELVGWDSRSSTKGEIDFAVKIKDKLLLLPYFQQNEHLVHLGDAGENRHFVAALTKHPEAKHTIVLISHFDTVGIEEYGELATYAFSSSKLAEEMGLHLNSLSEDARRDWESKEYLWGRGTMDMKAGLAIHMGLVEKAMAEDWPINLVLLTVPDEEVNSDGMRAAVPLLTEWVEKFGLEYKLFLNAEPVFSMNPNDTSTKVYSGSIGKIMPSALFYGKETHVGEPLSGITSSLLASFLTRKMEMNQLFKETVYGESTPFPITLQQKDMREAYSTQTPFLTSALYNVFTMNQTANDVMATFEQIASEAAREFTVWRNNAYPTNQEKENLHVHVMRYAELVEYAEKKLGKQAVHSLHQKVLEEQLDDREVSFQMVKILLVRCPELAPAIILLFAPPYYPPVNSSEDPLIMACIQKVLQFANSEYSLHLEHVHYFNGISDLSYVNYSDASGGWRAYEDNTPVWNKKYSIPFKAMTKLSAPVLNIGPFGKDAHKRTERLHIESAFVQTPRLIEQVIQTVLSS